MSALFSLPLLIWLLALSALSLILALALGRAHGGMRGRLLSIPLGILGALLARGFILLLLQTASDRPGAELVIGWSFFLWPGAVETIGRLFGAQWHATSPGMLLWYASIVGGITGMMAGARRIHDWTGAGWLSFPLDVTWGLGANTNACLLHLVNIGWGKAQEEPGTECHRYASGFALKPGFAFTQGAVMSSMTDGPGTPLFRHERLHVWQNRCFGPFYLLSYLAWMAVWVIPSLITGLVRRRPGTGPQEWCYFNNPFEAWAYALQGQARNVFSGIDPGLVWGGVIVALWSIPFFALVAVVSGWIAVHVW